MYLLIEYIEHSWHPGCAHLHCLEIHENYYNPVIIMETKDELVAWLKKKYPSAIIYVNGNTTISVERFNYKGQSKGIETYYMIKVTLGKPIVF